MNRPTPTFFSRLMQWIAPLLCCLPVLADCYTGPVNGSATTQLMTFSLAGYTYNYATPPSSGTVLASATVSTVTSTDGSSSTFVCQSDNINNYVNLNGAWTGSAGSQTGYYQLAPGLYLKLTFVSKSKVYSFSSLNMNNSSGVSLSHLAQLVFLNDGSGTVYPRLPNGFADTEVASFAEPNCVSNPSSYYGLNCLNVRIHLSVGAVLPTYSCTASVPSSVALGTWRVDQISNSTTSVSSFAASLNCSIPPVATVTFTGPAGSTGTSFANTGTAKPLSLELSYGGQFLTTGQVFSLPVTGANNSWNFGVSTLSTTTNIQPGTINVPVTWMINYQ